MRGWENWQENNYIIKEEYLKYTLQDLQKLIGI